MGFEIIVKTSIISRHKQFLCLLHRCLVVLAGNVNPLQPKHNRQHEKCKCCHCRNHQQNHIHHLICNIQRHGVNHPGFRKQCLLSRQIFLIFPFFAKRIYLSTIWAFQFFRRIIISAFFTYHLRTRPKMGKCPLLHHPLQIALIIFV